MLDQIQVEDHIRQIAALSIDQHGLLQIPAEFGAFLQFVHDLQPRTVVEIGTNTGASIWALGQICKPDTLLITVDISDASLVRGPFRDHIRTPTRVWRLGRPVMRLVLTQDGRTYHRLVGNSQSMVIRELVEAIMQIHGRETIDALFIDGDHTYEGVQRDFEIYTPLVRKGGLVALHDIVENDWVKTKNCFVFRLWNDLKSDPGWETASLKDESDTIYYDNPAWKQMGIAILRKLEGMPVETVHVYDAQMKWLSYRLGHSVNMAGQYLIHKSGGVIKRLIGRS